MEDNVDVVFEELSVFVRQTKPILEHVTLHGLDIVTKRWSTLLSQHVIQLHINNINTIYPQIKTKNSTQSAAIEINKKTNSSAPCLNNEKANSKPCH